MLIGLGRLGGRICRNRFQLLQLSHHVKHHLLQFVEAAILLIKSFIMLGLLLFDLPQFRMKEWLCKANGGNMRGRRLGFKFYRNRFCSHPCNRSFHPLLGTGLLAFFFLPLNRIIFFVLELNGLYRSCETLMGVYHWLFAIEETKNQWRK